MNTLFAFMPRNTISVILPFFFFSGLLACQEDTTTHQVETDNPSTQSQPATHTVTSPAPNPSATFDPPSLQGTVVGIEGSVYTIQSADGKNFSVEPTESVLVDESLEVGDRIELRYSESRQPMAVRKVRGEGASSEVPSNGKQEGMATGKISSMDKMAGIYVVEAVAGEKQEFTIDKNTLVDESIEIGDQVVVSISEDQKPIAIRKVRP